MRRRWATRRRTAFAAPRLERSPATTTEVSRTTRRIETSHRMSYIIGYFNWCDDSYRLGAEGGACRRRDLSRREDGRRGRRGRGGPSGRGGGENSGRERRPRVWCHLNRP